MNHPQQLPNELLSRINAYIAEGSTFHGRIAGRSEDAQGMRVDGTVAGSIHIEHGGVVHVGPTGKVEGGQEAHAIEADYVYLEGRVDGNVRARRIELAPTATVKGSIQYSEGLQLHYLAKVRGAVSFIGGDNHDARG